MGNSNMGDTSDFAYVLFALATIILLCMFAGTKKHEFPRTVLFFYCSLPFVFGLGLLTMTYLDFIKDEVHPVFFKTGLYAVSKFDSPVVFIVGLAFNVLLGLIVSVGGLIGMFKAITDTKFRFKK